MVRPPLPTQLFGSTLPRWLAELSCQLIRWSSTSTRADTISAAGRCGLRVELLDSWHDIDNENDLTWLRRELTNRDDALRAPATATVVKELLGDDPQLR